MLVRDLMTPDPITAVPDTPVFEARKLMMGKRIRHLLVVEDGRLVGMITDRDIRLNLPSQATSLSIWEMNYLLARLTVGTTMTKGVIVVSPDWDVAPAARLMLQHQIGALPVTEGEALVGIITETDFLRAFVAFSEQAAVLR